MFQPNLMIAALAALIPLVLGFIWYNPKTFGNAWMKGAGLTPESGKGMNMPLVFGLTYVFSFFIAITLNFITVHQYGLQSLVLPQNGHPVAEGSAALAAQVMEAYKGSYLSFKHGALHGTITAVLFVTPLLSIGALFERRSWKYILINAGYWIISLALMGGLVCQFTVAK
jgi:hypothetical protein